MKICWDNLDFLRYNKKTKKWYNKNTTFIYKEKCPECKEPFLGRKRSIEYCCVECANKNNKPNLGKKFSKKHRLKISKSNKGKHYHSDERNPNWKGGYRKGGIPRYDLYLRLGDYEEIRKNKNDKNILEVRCCVCSKWFIPNLHKVVDRLSWIETGKCKENRFYCSEKCKKQCSIYNQKRYTKGYEPVLGYLSKWPEIREGIKQRDNYKCQNLYCNKIIINDYNITVHHIDYNRENMSNENLITLCRSCNSLANKDREWHTAFYSEIKRRIIYEKKKNTFNNKKRFQNTDISFRWTWRPTPK